MIGDVIVLQYIKQVEDLCKPYLGTDSLSGKFIYFLANPMQSLWLLENIYTFSTYTDDMVFHISLSNDKTSTT